MGTCVSGSATGASTREAYDVIVRWPDMTDSVVRPWFEELERLVPTN
jgi:hypothetical protein